VASCPDLSPQKEEQEYSTVIGIARGNPAEDGKGAKMIAES
jgi:hypothetical protein